MSDATPPLSERFEARASSFGVELTKVPASEASDAIRDCLEAPAVGVPIPWAGVDLPDSVDTEPTPADLDAAVTGVTAVALAVAEYGSIVLQSTPAGVEPVSLFPDVHVAVLRERDIVPDMAAAFEWFGETVRETRGSAILATGPSATADMGDLVYGAHGPRDVHVIVIP